MWPSQEATTGGSARTASRRSAACSTSRRPVRATGSTSAGPGSAASEAGADGGGLGSHSIEGGRRPSYVWWTRPGDRLDLCRARQRGIRGKIVQRAPSRFLLEIPAELVEEREEVAPIAPAIAKTRAGVE